MMERLVTLFEKARHTQRRHDAKILGIRNVIYAGMSSGDIVILCKLYAWTSSASWAFVKHHRTNYWYSSLF